APRRDALQPAALRTAGAAGDAARRRPPACARHCRRRRQRRRMRADRRAEPRVLSRPARWLRRAVRHAPGPAGAPALSCGAPSLRTEERVTTRATRRPRKRAPRERKHAVRALVNIHELTKAGTSLTLEISAAGEKIGQIEIGRGGLFWWGG